jgi:hypothetical protein
LFDEGILLQRLPFFNGTLPGELLKKVVPRW